MSTRPGRGGISRRALLKGAAAAAPYVITSAALGAPGRAAASERIVMGAIGIRGRGSGDLRWFMGKAEVQMVAVCDVNGANRRRAKAMVDKHYGGGDCMAYIDLRELLARDDIDAVQLTTGDNWHSLGCILAMKAGKDVFSEKPLSVTIRESQAVARWMRVLGRVQQTGMQRRSIGHFRFAVMLAREGYLGKLKAVHAEKYHRWINVYRTALPPQPEPIREEMDWDLWLGPAPWRPYNAQYHQRSFWGGHLDFAGGSITEWGSHTADLCQWAAGMDHTGPVEYKPLPGRDLEATYANGLKLLFHENVGRGSCGVRFEGDQGWVEVGDSGFVEAEPKSLLDLRRFRTRYDSEDHVQNFLNCVKTRTPARANAAVAHRSISACHAGNIALGLNRTVRWDPVKEEFPGDDEANRLRSRPYRAPWHL